LFRDEIIPVKISDRNGEREFDTDEHPGFGTKIDGHIPGLVRERHRSKEFIEFLSLADGCYPPDFRIRIIPDNHSSHLSKETMQWLEGKPNRFEFIYTPKHGSWLNLIEMFFSKMTRAFLRYLRIKPKEVGGIKGGGSFVTPEGRRLPETYANFLKSILSRCLIKKQIEISIGELGVSIYEALRSSGDT
jgi:transposase